MKGHIRERSPGHWAIVVEMRDPETGRRRRKWHSFSGTKRQAQVECARLISEIKVGTYIEPSKTTLTQFLDRWLDDVRARVSAKTHERYVQICHKNVAPLLGAIPLAKLKPEQIAQAYAKALTSGRRRGSGGLRHAHATHLLSSGVHPKVASERLGHSKVGITLDLYSHVLPNMQANAAALVDDALRAVINKREGRG